MCLDCQITISVSIYGEFSLLFLKLNVTTCDKLGWYRCHFRKSAKGWRETSALPTAGIAHMASQTGRHSDNHTRYIPVDRIYPYIRHRMMYANTSWWSISIWMQSCTSSMSIICMQKQAFLWAFLGKFISDMGERWTSGSVLVFKMLQFLLVFLLW